MALPKRAQMYLSAPDKLFPLLLPFFVPKQDYFSISPTRLLARKESRIFVISNIKR